MSVHIRCDTIKEYFGSRPGPKMKTKRRLLILLVLAVPLFILMISSRSTDTQADHVHTRELESVADYERMGNDPDGVEDIVPGDGQEAFPESKPVYMENEEWMRLVMERFKDTSNLTGIQHVEAQLRAHQRAKMEQQQRLANLAQQKEDVREDKGEDDVVDVIGSSDIIQTSDDHEASSDKEKERDKPKVPEKSNAEKTKSDITKVLLVTYMRGGSSLLGEAFNQNPDAFYWFEPVDAYYGHLYGTRHGFLPLDIFFNTNRTLREIPQVEKDVIIQGLRNIYDCNFNDAPADLLGNLNLLNIIHNSTSDFTWCIRKGINKYVGLNGTMISYRHPPVFPSFACKKSTDSVCTRSFDDKGTLEKCYKDLHYNKQGDKTVKIPGSAVAKGYSPLFFKKSTLTTYNKCLNISYFGSQKCIHLLDKTCAPKHLRAVKAVRLRLDLLEDILDAVPDLKVVIYFRDPRAIVVSRYYHALLSNMSQKYMRNEGALLCQRMRYELTLLPQLLSKYPNNIHVMQYEDVVKAPADNMREVYKFVGTEIHDEVEKWISGHLVHATKNDGGYGTSRTDPVATSKKWRSKLRKSVADDLNNVCSDVLKALRYEV